MNPITNRRLLSVLLHLVYQLEAAMQHFVIVIHPQNPWELLQEWTRHQRRSVLGLTNA
jgi:hypothetical protein